MILYCVIKYAVLHVIFEIKSNSKHSVYYMVGITFLLSRFYSLQTSYVLDNVEIKTFLLLLKS